jgi:EmrB/QacA subfamily drug resistance transporter
MEQTRPAQRGAVLACLATGSFINGINSSAIVALLPVIAHDLRSDLASISWVVMANLVALCSLLLIFGRLADMIGHRQVYLAGLGCQLAGSVAGAAAPSEPVLIAASILQAAGSGMTVAAGLVLVTRAFGEQERGKSVGFLTTITYAGLVAGPALGGLLTAALSWRSIYLLNVPVAVFGLALGSRVLPAQTATARGAHFDGAGAFLSAAGLTSLLVALNQAPRWGWTSLGTLACASTAALAVISFVKLELRQRQPMLDVRLFLDRLFSAAVLSAVLNYVASFFQMLLLPFYLFQGRGFGSQASGILLMVTGAAMLAMTEQAGKLSDRIGSRLLTCCGLLVSALGLGAMAFLNGDSGLIWIAVTELATGIGAGLFSAPNTSAILGEAPLEQRGVAAGIQAMARNIGMVLGVALAGTIFNERLAVYGSATGFMPAFRDAMLVGAGAALIGAAVSLTRGRFVRPATMPAHTHRRAAA